MSSDVGIVALRDTGLGLEIKTLVARFFRWVSGITSRSFQLDDVARLEKDIVEILATMEVLLPSFFMTISVHMLLHLPAIIRRLGPLCGYWMYSAERYQSHVTSLSHAKKNPEVGVESAWSLFQGILL
jgi:hypothetical protein